LIKDKGILFIATGNKYFMEAVYAARSCKSVMPDVPILLYTEAGNHDAVFDEIRTIVNPSFSTLDKVRCICNSPFEKTLFLDSDTFLTDSVSEIFSLLDDYEFVGTHETSRGFHYSHEMPEIPVCFVDINGGVLAFRKTENVARLLTGWEDEFYLTQQWLGKYGQSKWALTNDQPSLKSVVFKSGVKLYILPTEYNSLRFTGTYLYGAAKIVHGRGDIQKIALKMNEINQFNRVWVQQIGMMFEFDKMSLIKLLDMYLRITFLTLSSLIQRVFRRK
jgi:hypothetical protein